MFHVEHSMLNYVIAKGTTEAICIYEITSSLSLLVMAII